MPQRRHSQRPIVRLDDFGNLWTELFPAEQARIMRLVVRIPMQLGRYGGCKRILAPDGSELTPPTKPQPDGVLIKALARAWRWQRLLDRGVYSSVTQIAEAVKISKSYVSRIVRLALLAPELVEAILSGWVDSGL